MTEIARNLGVLEGLNGILGSLTVSQSLGADTLTCSAFQLNSLNIEAVDVDGSLSRTFNADLSLDVNCGAEFTILAKDLPLTFTGPDLSLAAPETLSIDQTYDCTKLRLVDGDDNDIVAGPLNANTFCGVFKILLRELDLKELVFDQETFAPFVKLTLDQGLELLNDQKPFGSVLVDDNTAELIMNAIEDQIPSNEEILELLTAILADLGIDLNDILAQLSPATPSKSKARQLQQQLIDFDALSLALGFVLPADQAPPELPFFVQKIKSTTFQAIVGPNVPLGDLANVPVTNLFGLLATVEELDNIFGEIGLDLITFLSLIDQDLGNALLFFFDGNVPNRLSDFVQGLVFGFINNALNIKLDSATVFPTPEVSKVLVILALTDPFLGFGFGDILAGRAPVGAVFQFIPAQSLTLEGIPLTFTVSGLDLTTQTFSAELLEIEDNALGFPQVSLSGGQYQISVDINIAGTVETVVLGLDLDFEAVVGLPVFASLKLLAFAIGDIKSLEDLQKEAFNLAACASENVALGVTLATPVFNIDFNVDLPAEDQFLEDALNVLLGSALEGLVPALISAQIEDFRAMMVTADALNISLDFGECNLKEKDEILDDIFNLFGGELNFFIAVGVLVVVLLLLAFLVANFLMNGSGSKEKSEQNQINEDKKAVTVGAKEVSI